jgi:hypothetical protein
VVAKEVAGDEYMSSIIADVIRVWLGDVNGKEHLGDLGVDGE